MEPGDIDRDSLDNKDNKALEFQKTVNLINKIADKLVESAPSWHIEGVPCYPTLEAIARRQRQRGMRGTRSKRRINRLKYERRMLHLINGQYSFAWLHWMKLNEMDLCPFPPPKGI